MKILIVGAGISGLAAAHYLREHEVTIVEKSDRPGGWIKTVHQDGFLFELGPRGFRPMPNTLELSEGLDLIQSPLKKRYLLQNNKLKPFSPLLLLRHGLLNDLFTKPCPDEDESIADFFARHFSKSFVENIVDPAVKGIFGGDPKELSMRSCFPTVWKRDQEKGTLLHFPKGKPTLHSFKQGMEELPKKLAQGKNIQYNTEFRGEFDADVTIITTPYGMTTPRLSLTTVSMGWHKAELPKPGFGFLVPSKEKKPFLGMTWDSEVFPQQRGKTRICIMMLEPNERVALEAAKEYLGLPTPDSLIMHTAENAIPQYRLNHHKELAAVRAKLPPNVYLIGSGTDGVAINDCITTAKNLSFKLLS
ncbi:MAG: protoporphyrinogen oxidase [Chlamydiales bacterium]|nr:protoporphyrinogen oxidase [Chlamydiales bacterium]